MAAWIVSSIKRILGRSELKETGLQRLFLILTIVLLLLTACKPAEPTPPPSAEPGSLYIEPDQAETWLFDSSHNAENLGLQSLESSGKLSFPPQSVSLYAITP